MPCCCNGSIECHVENNLSNKSETADVKGCDEQPTCTSIVWADGRGRPTVQLSLKCATRRDWAVRKGAGADPCSLTASRHGQSFRYWALRRHVVQVTRAHEEPSTHRIVLYNNPFSDWITACGVSRWLVDRGSRISTSSTHVGSGSPQSSPLESTPAALLSSTTTARDGSSERAASQSLPPGPSPPPPPQQQQQQPQATRPTRSPPQPLPYSVPTLAIGDVFLSCNTVAGLEHAADWDLAKAPLEPQAQAQASTQAKLPQAPHQPHSAFPDGPRGAAAPLDLGSELLLRMSPPVGGQRLMFVSKEGAELVRRALLLSRYDEIMAERKAAAQEATEDEGIENPQNAAATSRAAAAATTFAKGSSEARDPRVSGFDGLRAAGGARGGSEGRGDEEVGSAPPPAQWFRRSNTNTADRAPTRTSPSSAPAAKSLENLNSNSSLKSNAPDAPASEALLSGNSAETSTAAAAAAASTYDTLQLDLPSWLPQPIREAATAAARGVGNWMTHGIGGGGGGNAAAASGGAVGSLTALLARGAASDALDVSSGPRPRLPAPPLTRAMQLPPLPPPPPTPPTEDPDKGAHQQHHQQHGHHHDQRREGKEIPEVAEAGSGLQVAGGGASTASSPTGGSSAAHLDNEEILRELKQLEAAKVIADAEALLKSLKRGAWGSGGDTDSSDGTAGGFLPPFSFSSYVARLPLAAALKALLSKPANAPTTTTTTTTTQAAAAEHAAAGSVPVRRRFLLVPDSADEQAVMGSREIERLVADVDASASAAAAAAVAAREDEDGPSVVGLDDGASVAEGGTAGAAGSTRSSSRGSGGSVPGRRKTPRPRVALNMFFSDSSHWVLDVVDELEQGDASEAVVGSSSSSSSSGNNQQQQQQQSLPPEPFMRGAPSGPSEDLGSLVQLPYNPPQESLLLPGSGSSSFTTASSSASNSTVQHDSSTPSSATYPTAAAGRSGNSNHDDDDSSGSGGGGGGGTATSYGDGSGGGGRTPVFLLPGVTVSVRAADGTVLRLRPAFLSLQQLASALALVRDAGVAAWRWQRSAARWRVVSALDVLTVHSAGFPIMRFPPVSSSSSAGAAGGGGGGGAGSNGGNGDEDSDDGLPEAKELLREMGAGNRRSSSADALAAAAAAAAAAAPAPSGPLGVLSTLAVGVVSFSAWCVASAVDVWDDIYSRTPWGLEAIGVPQHVNVRPTYLEEHVQRLAEANAPAVAAAAAAVRSRAVQRALDKRARRRQQAQQAQQQEQPQPQQVPADTSKGEKLLPGGGDGPAATVVTAAATAGNQCPEAAAATSGAPEPVSSSRTPAPSAGTADATAAAGTENDDGSTAAAAKRQDRSSQRRRGRAAVAAAAAAAASAAFTGLSLQTETMAGLTVLLQFAWATARAAHFRVQREADVVFGAYGSGGGGDGVDGLLRLAGGRGSRDGGSGGFAAAAGGGSGLTLTASQDGELGLVARLDIRPVVAATATAKGAAAAAAASPASTASVNGETSTARALTESREANSDGQTSSSSPPSAPPAAAAGGGSPKPSGLSIRELRSPGQSGVRYELVQSATKLAPQVTRPHKFEVGLHLNVRKLLGDLPEDAPDQLLKLQQPMAGSVMQPAGGAAAAAAVGGGASGGSSRRAPAPAPMPEAHGLLLIGDLGLEEFEEMRGMRPPALGFADLGELLPPPGRRPGLAAAASPGRMGVHAGGAGFGDDSLEGEEEEEEDDGSGPESWTGSRGVGGGGGGRGGGGGMRPRGWAAGGRGVWGRWGR